MGQIQGSIASFPADPALAAGGVPSGKIVPAVGGLGQSRAMRNGSG